MLWLIQATPHDNATNPTWLHLEVGLYPVLRRNSDIFSNQNNSTVVDDRHLVYGAYAQKSVDRRLQRFVTLMHRQLGHETTVLELVLDSSFRFRCVQNQWLVFAPFFEIQ